MSSTSSRYTSPKLLRRRYDVETLLNLIKAAKGELKSDIIIRNVDIVDVILGDIREKVNIAIWGSYIVRVGYFDVEKFRGPNTLIIDGSRYEVATPGFIDPHIHIESSLLTVTEFSRLVLMHGTTAVAADPHEIANVLGIEGVRLFIEESRYVPLKVYFYAPSCVPPTSMELDTPGSKISLDDVKELLKYDEVIGLGEVMDFHGVINGNAELLSKISYSKSLSAIVDGHAPQLPEDLLIPYAIVGIRGDHESVFLDEALSKLRVGIRVLIREGSAWKDLEELSKILTYMKVNTRYMAFASDDLEVLELVSEGHMDRILRKAVSLGIDPITAVQMATLNAAEYLGLGDDIGSLNPGKLADIVLLDKFRQFKVKDVVSNGELVVIDGKFVWRGKSRFKYPSNAYRTINIKFKPKPNDLLIRITGLTEESRVKVLAVKVVLGKAITKKDIINARVVNGYLVPESPNAAYVAVIERHHATGNIGKGFITGLGLSDGAIAQTIAHDVHNIIVIGKRPEDMAKAVNELVEMGGGMVAVKNGEILSKVHLPIAGLMSDREYDVVVNELNDYIRALESEMNINFRYAFMTIALLSLPVIPEVRITDKGLVDVLKGRVVSPLIE